MRLIPFTNALLPAAALHWPTVLPRLHWLLRTPYAHTHAVQANDALLAVGGGLACGANGLVTLLRVRDDAPEALPLLVRALVAALAPDGHCRMTVAPHQVDAFVAMGWRVHDTVHRFTGNLPRHTNEAVQPLEPQHRLALLHLDRRATGMDRHPLLLEHEYLGRVYLERGRVRGVLLPLLGQGLIVAEDADVGLVLQGWLFPSLGELLVPTRSAGHSLLQQAGMHRQHVGTQLVHGDAPSGMGQLIHAEPFGVA